MELFILIILGHGIVHFDHLKNLFLFCFVKFMGEILIIHLDFLSDEPQKKIMLCLK